MGSIPTTGTNYMLYTYINLVLFGLLFIIWHKDDWLNIVIKAVFLIMTIWSAFEALHASGYIIKLS